MITRIVAYKTDRGEIFNSLDAARIRDCADALSKLHRQDRGPGSSPNTEAILAGTFEWLASNWGAVREIMESYRSFKD